ncbi:MAG: DUF1598 domain-containing protein [Planctomycetota bacterium]
MLRTGSVSAAVAIVVGFCLTYSVATQSAFAGLGGLGAQRAVGGVMIDPDGSVRAASKAEQQEMASLIRDAVGRADGQLAVATPRRFVSLKSLQKAIAEAEQTGGTIDADLGFLAGLQRIEFLIVDAENQDILIAGPAEPWKLNADGTVVGKQNGQSVLRLEDLMTAFASVETARDAGGIRCSIEPTAEGRQRLQKYLAGVRLRSGQNPKFLEAGMREAFGPQQILLDGLPTDSRMARTLVAADFEMKRIAMALVDSPVAGLPSYLEMARNTRQSIAQNPRWWMACDYEPIARDNDGLVWKLTGQGVKTLTEQDIVKRDGSVAGSGQTDRIAQRWATTMTEQYESLSRTKPVFRDLRNAMDMVVIATLIRQQNLDTQAGLDLSVLRGESASVPTDAYPMPRTLQPQCSFIRGNAGWTVTASGGVNIDPFSVVQAPVQSSDLRLLVVDRPASDRWWWDSNER